MSGSDRRRRGTIPAHAPPRAGDRRSPDQRPYPWVDDGSAALLTDLYQLTMLQAYQAERMHEPAVFSLFVRRLPERRNYLIACGLNDALRYLETLRFAPDALEYIASLPEFHADFIDWLADFRFTGDVHAVPEGTPLFADEPLLEIVAPLPQAQLIETFVMNQVQHQTLVASKAARVVEAAAGRAVIDFGLRRMHGTDAGLKAARAFHIAGVAGTSNVLAGQRYGIPVRGTMAHSYIQSHDDEAAAFRAFARLYPSTILLVDTYDTLDGVRRVVELARELGDDFDVAGIRLDSGDLSSLAIEARRILDDAGLHDVTIFASGSLDEYRIAELLARAAPIDGFGVGTRMGVSSDAPSLDTAYKLTEYAGRGRTKLSPGKDILPGRKQVFRFFDDDGVAMHDVIARADERLPATPLLRPVMRGGERLPDGDVSLEASRVYAAQQRDRLPARIRALEPADPPYEVEVSNALRMHHEAVAAEAAG